MTEAPTVIVRVEVPVPPVIGLMLKFVVKPGGAVAERVTDPVKPAPGETDRVDVADAPVWMIMAEALDNSLKSGRGVTVTVMLTVWKPDVEFPMMSMV